MFMKKILMIVLVLSTASCFACSQKQTDSASESAIEEQPIISLEDTNICMPPWELALPVSKEGIYGKGQGHTEKRLAQNRDLADRRARHAIAISLESKIPSIIAAFLQKNTYASHFDSMDFAAHISHDVLMQPLKGAYVAERYICPDGTVYSLAFLPFVNLRDLIIAEGLKESQKTEQYKGFYEVFASKKYLLSLDSIIIEHIVD